MTNIEAEKRRFTRIKQTFPVRFNLEGPNGKLISYRSRCQDISQGGICLQTGLIEEEVLFNLLSGEQRIVLYFTLPQENIISLGEITWAIEKPMLFSKKFCLGVKFVDLPNHNQEKLASYISKSLERKKSQLFLKIEGFLYKKIIKNIILLSNLGKRSVLGEADTGLNFDHMYRNRPEGKWLIGKFIDRILLSLPAVQATRNRKKNIILILQNEVKNNKILGKKTKILDLASGPARYLIELVTKQNQGVIEALCVDIDNDSLNFGKRLSGIRPIRYLQKDILSLQHLKDVVKGTDWRPNVIVISGLFVYQPDNIMKMILKDCYEFLEEDGLLLFCNQLNNPSRKLMEKACSIKSGGSWSLFYRPPDHGRVMLLELGYKNVMVELDEWQMYYLTSARK